MTTTKKIPEDALNIIASMDITSDNNPNFPFVARITDGQLPRDLYVSVDKVLKAMGGKWDRHAKGHVFDGDPSDAIDSAVLTGSYTDKKQALQFFETPEALADELVAAAEIRDGMRVLEPSAGRGRITRAIRRVAPLCNLVAIEIDPHNFVELNTADGGLFILGDFMKDFAHDETVDRVVMNPPFSKRQDVDHVTRAFSMLSPGGRLVSVVSGSAMHRIDKKGEAFKALVKRCGSSYDLPEGTFKESGTNVRASVVILNKE
jgi:predicted RNA methylase